MNNPFRSSVFFLFTFASIAGAQDVSPPAVQPPIEVENTATPTAGYDRGFFVESADHRFRLTMGGYIQAYFDHRFLENTKDTSTFRVRRVRIKWSGFMFSKNTQYEVEYDFAANKLLEAVLQLVHNDELKFRAGQYHIPFSLEQATSSSTLQFVDRSILQTYFGVADEREPGAGFNGILFNNKLEYDVGIFNGEGLNTLNQNNRFRYAGRLTFNIAGKYGTEFSDTKWSETPQIALAVGSMFNDTLDPLTAPVGGVATADKKVTSLTGEANAKYKGLSFHGAFFYQHTNPDVGITTDDKGCLGQVGYFVIPKKLEIAARVGHVYVDSGNDQGEYTAAINYFIENGHQFKFQVDYGVLTLADGIAIGDDRLDQQVRAQLQLKL